jgi:hypothetical protein
MPYPSSCLPSLDSSQAVSRRGRCVRSKQQQYTLLRPCESVCFGSTIILLTSDSCAATILALNMEVGERVVPSFWTLI